MWPEQFYLPILDLILTIGGFMIDEKDKIVEVCSECLQASCWHGEFMCFESRDAGTVLKPGLLFTTAWVVALSIPNARRINPASMPSVR